MNLKQIKIMLLYLAIALGVAAFLFGTAFLKVRNYLECREFKHSFFYCVTK